MATRVSSNRYKSERDSNHRKKTVPRERESDIYSTVFFNCYGRRPHLYVSSLTPSFFRPVTPASGPSPPRLGGGLPPTVASPTRARALESGTTISVPVNTVCESDARKGGARDRGGVTGSWFVTKLPVWSIVKNASHGGGGRRGIVRLLAPTRALTMGEMERLPCLVSHRHATADYLIRLVGPAIPTTAEQFLTSPPISNVYPLTGSMDTVGSRR